MTTTPNPHPDDQPKPQQPKPVQHVTAEEAADADEKLVLISPDAADSPRDFSLWAGVLFLLALTIYSPAMRGEFLWDDDRHVSQNVNLRSAEGLRNIWTKFGPRAGGTPQYYPLTHTTYWIEYQLFGKGATSATLDPLVFHITNILLHATCATLLWFILRRLRVPGAWLASAVFAVHPVMVESVAWISERKNVLSGAFFFGAILAYLAFEAIGEKDSRKAAKPRDNWNLYALSLGLFICGLLSKTVVCSLPAVVLLILWWKRGRLRMSDVALLVPFFAVGIGLAGITSWIERKEIIGPHYAFGDWDFTWAQRLAIAGRAIWFYLGKLFAPVELTFTYPRWNVSNADVLGFAGLGAAIALALVLWALRKRLGLAPLVAWLIYVGMLVPALGFFDVYPMRYSFVADHFQYHAAAAMITLVVGAIVYGFQRVAAARPAAEAASEQSPTPYVASAVVLMVLGVLAWRQSRIYADSVTLWRDTVAKNPDAWHARHNLGIELTDLAQNYQKVKTPEAAQFFKELIEEALGNLETAATLRPENDDTYVDWGRALWAKGNQPEAMAKFEEALRVNPKNVKALTNRAFLFEQSGKTQEALDAYAKALSTCEGEPSSPRTTCGQIALRYALALDKAGKKDESFAMFAQAVRLAPLNADARYQYGTSLARRAGEAKTLEEKRAQLSAAADQFLAVLDRNPRHIDSRVSLAMLMLEAGNLEGARRELITAAGIDPQNARVMYAAQLYSAAYTASTRPSTTQSSTQPSTQPAAAAGAATTPASSQPVP
jgi:tetratricopeptide (TPR) repeat protein